MRRSESPRELLAHQGPKERLLARSQLRPNVSAEKAAQDSVGVDGLEKDFLRPVKGGERGPSSELGGFFGLEHVLARNRQGRKEETESEGGEDAANAHRPRPAGVQYPVAVSVELGRANTLSVIGTLPMRSSSPSRRATVDESLVPLT